MKDKAIEFFSSITGLSSIAALSLLTLKKYELAATLFAAISVGAAGVIWERYSRKAGAPLNISAFGKKGMPDRDEVGFLAAHFPQVILAVAAYYLARRNRSGESMTYRK